jgi:hypothetical protein
MAWRPNKLQWGIIWATVLTSAHFWLNLRLSLLFGDNNGRWGLSAYLYPAVYRGHTTQLAAVILVIGVLLTWQTSGWHRTTPGPRPERIWNRLKRYTASVRARVTRRFSVIVIAVGVLGAGAYFISRRVPDHSFSTARQAMPPESKTFVPDPQPEILLATRKQPMPQSYVAIPRQRYVRPEKAPNGAPWPAASAYVGRAGNEDGHSEVTVDNTQSRSDMLVKLFDRQYKRPVVVRIFFLRAGEQFALEGVAAGNYDIRYQNLDSGVIWRSEPFALKEAEDEHQIRATGASLTLYEVPNGNTHPEIIGPEEF